MSAENDLTSKIGPLPAWAWGAIVVGGVLLFRWWRQRTAPVPPSAVAPTDPNADPSTVTSTDPFTSAWDAYLSGDPTNPAFPVSGGGMGPGGTPGPITDAQWAKLAGDYLIGLGGVPTAIETALANYLAGLPLTANGQAIVDAALQHFGSPPEGVLPVTPPGTTTPPPTDTGSGDGGGGIPSTPAPTPTPDPTPAPAPAPAPAPSPAPFAISPDGPPTSSTIPVHWTAYPGADEYQVWLDSHLHGTTSRLSTIIGGLSPGTQHSVYVIAMRQGQPVSESNHLTGVRTAG